MTRLLFVKLLRDLRSIWPRLVLMIGAMGITLVMFSAILYLWSVARREISHAYLSTHPASATMLLERGLGVDAMAGIATDAGRQPGVIEAAVRAQLTLQVQQDGGAWGPNPLQIFVARPDDPMRIETLAFERGSWPPAAGEILLERSSFPLLDVQVGDVVVVQAPDGRPTPLRISGAVYYPGLAPSFQEQKGHGFISTASLPLLGEPLALDALKVQIADHPGLIVPTRDRDVIVARSRALAGWLQNAHGAAVREIQVPRPYAHPHQAQADSLLLGLLTFGVAGLLLSAILVATMFNGLLTQHIPQIGIMKAIGARSSRVFQLYLLLTFLIGVAATALALVPGIAISRALSPAILTLLGIEARSHAAPWWTYVVVVASGLGLPVLVSLASLVRTSRTTVREALDHRGVHRLGSAIRVDARLELVCRDRLALMAFRNMFRRRARLLLSVGLLASAGAVFVAGMSTMAGFQAVLERDQALRRWDVEVQVSDVEKGGAVDMATLVAARPDVTRVEAWSVVKTSVIPPGQEISMTRTYPDQGHGSIAVTVVPPDSSLLAPPLLTEGRWLRRGETGVVVISRAALSADLPNVRSGETIQLSMSGRVTSWQVVGVAESGGHAGAVFITAEGFKAATGTRHANLLRIVTDRHDEGTRTAVAQDAERVLTLAGIVVRSAASVSRADAAGAGHMLPLILVFLGLSLAMGLVGFAGLASTMSTNVLERTREFGVMRAIGARPSTVRRLVVLEGVFIAVVSCVIAAVPTLPLAAAMSGNLPVSVPLRISVSGVAIWVVLAMLGAAIATLAPAVRASRVTVREALTCL